MSIRQIKSSASLSSSYKDEDDFSDPLLGASNASDPGTSNGSSKKPNKSTVLDLGFDYWNGSQGSGSVLGSAPGNYSPYKPPYSYRMGNSKISINRPLATAIIVITIALFFLTVVAYSRKQTRTSNYNNYDHDHLMNLTFISSTIDTPGGQDAQSPSLNLSCKSKSTQGTKYIYI